MQLRTLSLVGFKSFADRTRLHFDSGVNVVVGPNGSGKSNLLDALAWVMGTQATKSLRTESMGDVIFAGTATRPAMQRAEVNLTFDNTDNFIPLDFPEVTITRRLYRDGTSEYEINGTTCRLLDIQELLSDGGVGRHQHVLVGQGEIGDILNARADEHRLVIEEAAGITKHRSRRDRALRRLEKTGVDIDRLRDMLAQNQRRLRPLKRQANAAERYDAVRAEARALRLWLGGEELRRIRTRTTTATTERDGLTVRLGANVEERSGLTDLLESLRGESGEFGKALERDTAAAARLETVIERLQRISGIARERRRSLSDRHEGAAARRSDLEAESGTVREELSEAATQSTAAESLAERRGVALRALEDEERALAEQLQMPAEGLIATLRGDLRALETAAERDRLESESTERRRETVTDRLEHERAEMNELQSRIHSLDAEAGGATDIYRSAAKSRTEAEEALDRATQSHNAAEVDLARAVARHEAIEAALSGVLDPEATEKALSHDGVSGTIVSRLDVPSDLANAVDAALGAWRTALAATDRDTAADAVHDLKAEGLGGIGLIGVAGDTSSVPARQAGKRWGVPALVDLLGPAADQALACALLGDVIVVEGWSAAIRIVDEMPGIRVVTPEGDLVGAEGFILASVDGAGPAALEAAAVAVEDAERSGARARSSFTTAQREYQTAHQAERDAAEDLEAVEGRLTGSTEALVVFGRSTAEAESEISRIEDRTRALHEAASLRNERLSQLQDRIADLEGEEAERHEAWEALNRRREDVARRREEARQLREEAAAAHAGIEERRRLLTARLSTIDAELTSPEDVEIDPAVIESLRVIEGHSHETVVSARSHVEALRARQ
ncbi:MAG: AAA family ATPase, partial [Acidimicrobiia bacterium]|nr:AAA family ATPase [Acidimicrobiia bacterium]